MKPIELQALSRVSELQQWSDGLRAAGRRVALVPTMGALHEGHLSLVRVAQSCADRVVVSLFVNPTQFGPNEDLASYPRPLEQDLAQLRRVGADVVFTPTLREIYPDGNATQVEVFGLTQGLCGRGRPGHFRGVTNVVTRLFLAARPHLAVFGEKDYQQLVTIRRMTRDLGFGIEIVGGPIVREPDGLAMSSRNAYLSAEARRQACALNAALHEARELFHSGESGAQQLIRTVRRRIEKEPLAAIEYIELCDAETLEPLHSVTQRAVLALAVVLEGGPRLIDNAILEVL